MDVTSSSRASLARRTATMLATLLLGGACALGAASAHGGRLSVPVAVSAAQAPTGALMVGISDESPATFSDPRFQWLGLSTARLVVPWDVTSHPRELFRVRVWLLAARIRNISPLIAFDGSVRHPSQLPAVSTYAGAVRRFMRKFPWVTDYSPWNEENHVLEPTSRDPRRAAAYFNAVAALCGSCNVTAADVLDEPNMTHWLRAFLPYAHHPRLWGLHNYFDLNHGGHRNTSRMLALVPGDIWFTEVGGLVWRYNRPTHTFVVRGDQYAARAAARLLRLGEISPRIRRIYYYHWQISETLAYARRHHGVTWDSALIAPNCALRPAFDVIARALGRNLALAPHAIRERTGCRSPVPAGRLPGTVQLTTGSSGAGSGSGSGAGTGSGSGSGSGSSGSSTSSTSTSSTTTTTQSTSSSTSTAPSPTPCVLGIVCSVIQ